MNTENKDALREVFEAWASSYWARGLHATYSQRFNNYDDAVVEGFWQAFQHSHKLTLSSLCIGADVTSQGAQIALMSKIGEGMNEVITVLASGYTAANRDGFVKVLL